MRIPPRQRWLDSIEQPWGHINEGGCAGACVEIFIGAAHGKICISPGHIYRQCTNGMGQIPNHSGANAMGLGDNGLHVMFAACPVINLCDHHSGHLFGDMVQHICGRRGAQLIARITQRHQPFHHIEIGWKISTV